MFLLQLKHETLRLMRSSTLWLLVVFIAASVGFGLYNGSQQLASKKQSINELLGSQKEEFEIQKHQADSIARGLKPAGNWWRDPSNPVAVMWWGGRIMALDPAPKSIIASGMSDLQPDAWQLTLLDKTGRGNSEFENPMNLSLGTFDLSFVISFLMPLLVISLSFNLISGEREQGTLDLLRSQPVSFATLFFQKMLARFVLLTGLMLLITLPTLAMLGVSLTSSAAWVTAGTAVLYLLFWFLLALGINLLGRSSAQNALLCMVAWLGFTLILPVLINMLAQTVHPVPSRAGYQIAVRDAEEGVEANREQILDEYYAEHPDAIRVAEDELDWYDWNVCKNYYRDEFMISTVTQQKIDSLNQWYDFRTDRQSNLANSMTLFSPTLSVHRQMNDLAGTSRVAFKQSIVSLTSEQQSWKSFFVKRFEADQSLSSEDYDEFLRLPERISSAGIPMAYNGLCWLVLQCLLVGVWVLWRGKRHFHLSQT